MKSRPTQEYTRRFEHRHEYLYARVSGQHASYEISIAFWRKIAEEPAMTDYTRVVIEEDIPEAVSLAETFHLASDLAELDFKGVRIAFSDRYAEQEELNKFAELVAENRGMDAKIFTDVERQRSGFYRDNLVEAYQR